MAERTVIPCHPRESGEKAGIHKGISAVLIPQVRVEPFAQLVGRQGTALSVRNIVRSLEEDEYDSIDQK